MKSTRYVLALILFPLLAALTACASGPRPSVECATEAPRANPPPDSEGASAAPPADKTAASKSADSANSAEPARASATEAAGAAEKTAPPSRAVSVSPELAAQAVYQILLAEIALQRDQAGLAEKAYADLAFKTQDPRILERTAEIAAYTHDFDQAFRAVDAWLAIEPDSSKAQRMRVGLMVLTKQTNGLAPKLIDMLKADQDDLAENLLALNRMFAHDPDRLAVFRLIDQACAPFFGIAEAHYAVAVAANSAGAVERALSESEKALTLRPDWSAAALVKARLLARRSPGEAIAFLKDFTERRPSAGEAHLLLARLLLSERRYVEARRHFDQLLQTHPDSPDVIYPLALLALQQDDKALAENLLKRFLTLDVRDKSAADYYLGQIAEEDRRLDEAIARYAAVETGEHYLAALLRRARLLSRQGQLAEARALLREARTKTPDERAQLAVVEASLLREAKRFQEAFDVLEKQLEAQPEQADLLYESALLAEKLERLDILETRLRKLIALQPDSAPAYNALGYSYADRKLRLPEARELIEKALSLSPGDSYILDSLGWVLYRLGDTEGALAQLEKAYAVKDDPEIAAHLGEVLWTLGRKDDARRTLLDARKKYPDNEVLLDATRKFAP